MVVAPLVPPLVQLIAALTGLAVPTVTYMVSRQDNAKILGRDFTMDWSKALPISLASSVFVLNKVAEYWPWFLSDAGLDSGPNALPDEELGLALRAPAAIREYTDQIVPAYFAGRYTTFPALNNWMRDQLYLGEAGYRTTAELSDAVEHWMANVALIQAELPAGSPGWDDLMDPRDMAGLSEAGPLVYKAILDAGLNPDSVFDNRVAEKRYTVKGRGTQRTYEPMEGPKLPPEPWKKKLWAAVKAEFYETAMLRFPALAAALGITSEIKTRAEEKSIEERQKQLDEEFGVGRIVVEGPDLGPIESVFRTLKDAVGAIAKLPTLWTGAALLTATQAAAFWNNQKNIGAARHAGKASSMKTTGDTMLKRLASKSIPILSSIGVIGFLELVTKWRTGEVGLFGTWLEPKISKDEDLVANATKNAEAMLLDRMKHGLEAHTAAMAAEMIANAKHLGLTQIAGFLADLGDFKPLASKTIGKIEDATVGIPFQQYVYEKYRPVLPGMADVTMAYAKKEIPPGPIPKNPDPESDDVIEPAGHTPLKEPFDKANLYTILSRYGLSDDLIAVYSHHLFLDPRLSELIRMGQFYNPQIMSSTKDPTPFAAKWIKQRPWLLEEIGIDIKEWNSRWWYYYKASVGGYEPADVKVVVETASRAVVRRDQTLGLDAVTRMHRDGFIDDEMKYALVEELWARVKGPTNEWFMSDPIYARARATDLRTTAELLEDGRNVCLRGFSRGLIPESEAKKIMLKLGMPLVRAEFEIMKEKLGLTRNIRYIVPDPSTADE